MTVCVPCCIFFKWYYNILSTYILRIFKELILYFQKIEIDILRSHILVTDRS